MKKPVKKKAAAKRAAPKLTPPPKSPVRPGTRAKIAKPKEKPPVSDPVTTTATEHAGIPFMGEKITVIACSTNPEQGGYDLLLSDGATVTASHPQHPGDDFVPETANRAELNRQVINLTHENASLKQKIVDLQRAADEARTALDAMSASTTVGVAPPSSTEALGKTGDLPVHKSMEDIEADALAEAGIGKRKSRKA